LKILLILVALISVFYFHLIQRRKIKYEKISQYLKAEYVKKGFFEIGQISGFQKGRKYIIKSHEAGGSPMETHFRTILSMECKNQGMLILIKQGFFKRFPDWEYANKLKDNELTNKDLNRKYKYHASYRTVDQDYNFNEKQKSMLANMLHNQSIKPDSFYDSIKRKGAFPALIQINLNKISLDIGGLVFDKQKIKELIDYLEDLSKEIEARPII